MLIQVSIHLELSFYATFEFLFLMPLNFGTGDDHTVLLRTDRRVILTWALYVASIVPALMNINTGLILSGTGAIGGSSLAYIVPGLTFIAVYHAEFKDLVISRWKSSSKYLWQYPSEEITDDEHTIYLEIVSWYLLLMPLWSSIAQLGGKTMSDYIDKEDSLSPGLLKPKRLTVVAPLNKGTQHKNEHAIQLPRCPSDSATDQISGDEDVFLLHSNSQKVSYGSDNLNEPYLVTRLSAVEIEEELKEESPNMSQFYIAMMYVVIGVLAMVLGLISILTK